MKNPKETMMELTKEFSKYKGENTYHQIITAISIYENELEFLDNLMKKPITIIALRKLELKEAIEMGKRSLE